MKGRVYWRGLSVGVNYEKPILSQWHAQARFRGEKPTGGVYPAATIKRACARIAAGTNEVWFGGPCRGRTYGPLIKSGGRPMIRTARCCEGFPVYR